MSRTPFVETEALLAVMDGDLLEAARIVGAMLPGEQRTLAAALNGLERLIPERCVLCREVLNLCDPHTWVTMAASGVESRTGQPRSFHQVHSLCADQRT